MNSLRVTDSAIIKAPAPQVYAIIADYRNGHPRIVPKPWFTSLEVEQGGFGAGTIIRFRMRVLGRTHNFRATITVPEPGRVLVETNEPTGSVTTFTVTPIEQGGHAQVTIATELQTRDGVFGPMERFFTKKLLLRIYKQELALLAEVAGKSQPTRS